MVENGKTFCYYFCVGFFIDYFLLSYIKGQNMRSKKMWERFDQKVFRSAYPKKTVGNFVTMFMV